jgi:hypothetical protein
MHPLRASPQCFFNQCPPNATIGPGYQNCSVYDFHIYALPTFEFASSLLLSARNWRLLIMTVARPWIHRTAASFFANAYSRGQRETYR